MSQAWTAGLLNACLVFVASGPFAAAQPGSKDPAVPAARKTAAISRLADRFEQAVEIPPAEYLSLDDSLIRGVGHKEYLEDPIAKDPVPMKEQGIVPRQRGASDCSPTASTCRSANSDCHEAGNGSCLLSICNKQCDGCCCCTLVQYDLKNPPTDMMPPLDCETTHRTYYYFAPYNWRHVLEHQCEASQWNANRGNPYSNRIFQSVYDSVEAKHVPPVPTPAD